MEFPSSLVALLWLYSAVGLTSRDASYSSASPGCSEPVTLHLVLSSLSSCSLLTNSLPSTINITQRLLGLFQCISLPTLSIPSVVILIWTKSSLPWRKSKCYIMDLNLLQYLDLVSVSNSSRDSLLTLFNSVLTSLRCFFMLGLWELNVLLPKVLCVSASSLSCPLPQLFAWRIFLYH